MSQHLGRTSRSSRSQTLPPSERLVKKQMAYPDGQTVRSKNKIVFRRKFQLKHTPPPQPPPKGAAWTLVITTLLYYTPYIEVQSTTLAAEPGIPDFVPIYVMYSIQYRISREYNSIPR